MALSPDSKSLHELHPTDDNLEDEPSSPKPPTMFLHVLSPSTAEVPSQLSFPSIPVGSTVGQLKEKIRDALPARPALERQRLIYQGRLLAKDTDTMLDIFGQQAINDPIAHKLHLVLRPDRSDDGNVNASTPARAASPIPPVLRAPNHLPIMTSGTQHPEMPPVTGTATHQPNHRAYNNLPLPHGPILSHFQTNLPPHLQNILNHQLATLNQQHPQPHIMVSGPPGQLPQTQASRHPVHTNNQQASIGAQPTFQQNVAEHQQARASAGLHGIPQDNLGDTNGAHATGTTGSQGQEQIAPSAARPQPPVSNMVSPGPTTHLTTQGQNPNGATFIVNDSTTVFPHAAGNSLVQGVDGRSVSPRIALPGWGIAPIPVPAVGPAVVPPHPASQHQRSLEQHITVSHTNPQASASDSQRLNEGLLSLHIRLANLENSLARGQAPSDREISEARQQYTVLQNHHLQSVLNSFNHRISDLSVRAEAIRNLLNRFPNPSQTSQIPNRPTISQPMQQSRSAPSANAPYVAPPATVYLISSPTGPQAVVYPPSGGIYSSNISRNGRPVNQQAPFAQVVHPGPGIIPAPDPVQLHQQILHNTNELINRARTNGVIQQRLQAQQIPQQPLQQQPAHGINAAAQPQGQGQAQAQNRGGRELVRIMIPVGGHLWLLIRLIGVILFLTSSGGWMRMIMLFFATAFVFTIQIGVFHRIRRALWDPVRRHVEGLVPLENDAPPDDSDTEEEEDVQRRPAREPDPREVAERLLRTRQQQNRGRVVGQFRRIERAFLLFLGSLIPGVGERHVAAREEALAAARRAEERERERQAREIRARQEREQQEQQVANATEIGASNDSSGSDGAATSHTTDSSSAPSHDLPSAPDRDDPNQPL